MDSLWGEPEVTNVEERERSPRGLRRIPGMSPRAPKEGRGAPRKRRIARRETIWAWVSVALLLLVGIGVAVTQQGSAPPAPAARGTATATIGSVTSVLVLDGV